MTDLNIHVGDGREAMALRFVEAWRAAERGERRRERHLSFDRFETLARTLTPRRLELLRHVHAHPPVSIAGLARELGRDYRRVHEDVQALILAGLIEKSDSEGLSAPYDHIETRIAL
ncbi:MAG: hypothetical protein WDM92_11625 [Caulobacteraceae bacterium]